MASSLVSLPTLGRTARDVVGARSGSGSSEPTISGVLLKEDAAPAAAHYVDCVGQVGYVARRHGLDILIVLAAAAGVIQVVVEQDSANAPRSALWFSLPALAVVMLSLLACRRFPFAAPAALWLLVAALSFIDGRLVSSVVAVFLAGMAAAILLGNRPDPVQARVGLAIVVSSALIVVYNAPDSAGATFVFIPLLFAICWLGGFALRTRVEQAEAAEVRAARAEQERDAAARIAVAEERARIARELHDIVAHAVSVMVLQVGAVRHRLPQTLSEDADALRGVERTGRTALAEMRRLLGAMRAEGDDLELTPQPGLDGLDALFAEVARAGLPVELHVEGRPVPLTRAIDLSAYRIVQEGLTNALKHAKATHADVTLHYAADKLRIEVRDDGAGLTSSNGHGHGLVGVRERVKIYGGEMTAGPASEGGFVLNTQLPLGGDKR
jgi:signal transduction histidine kinase